MRLAISKRRTRRLAAGTVSYVESLGTWYLTLYMVVDGIALPFGASPFQSAEEAIREGNETLTCSDGDWVEVEEEDVIQYIQDNSRNSWNPGASQN